MRQIGTLLAIDWKQLMHFLFPIPFALLFKIDIYSRLPSDWNLILNCGTPCEVHFARQLQLPIL